jgi:hypothetical protein
MERDRMFRVIVVGGLALVGPTACSSTVGTSDASDVTSDFPSELPVFIDAPSPTDATDVPDMSFPTELPVFVDAGRDDGVTDTGVDSGFPLECPAGESVCAGACVDLATDSNNCGRCGAPCGTSEFCSSGICVPIPTPDAGSGG